MSPNCITSLFKNFGNNVTSLILKIIDSLGCEKFVYLTCGVLYGKQFEDFEVFMFQDYDIYLFEGP